MSVADRVRRCGRAAAVCCALLTASPAWAAGTATAVEEGPHWRNDRCDACHTAPPDANGGTPALKHARAEQTCGGCHDGSTALRCGHRAPLDLPEAMTGQLPASYTAALADGKVDCTTCHDLTLQCGGERRAERIANPAFLRDGPFRNVSEQCYVCHDKKNYRKLSPHRQLSRRTGVMQETCLLCHRDVPPAFGAGGPRATFYLDKDLPGICMGCHPVAPHPGFGHPLGKKTVKWTHFVKPPAEIRETMRRQAAASGIELPLEPATDRIVCSTCHNPHDPTLPGYPDTIVSNMGDYKLRRTNICGACHEM